MNLRQVNPQVFETPDKFVQLSRTEVDVLKTAFPQSPNRKVRICVHKQPQDPLQEMLIVHGRKTYVRPHKHTRKIESLHIVEGVADAVFFDDQGSIQKIVRLGSYTLGLPFYYRLEYPLFHSLLIRSEFLVFYECALGPFDPMETVYAPWAPDGKNESEATRFMENMEKRIDQSQKNEVKTT